MEVNYPEVEVVAESARGFALTGSVNMSPVFPPDVRVSGSSEFDLRASAVWRNKLLMAKSARQED
eukprot:1880734-Amphidinium_carterae.1